jgi:hypothetical protein
MSEATLEAARGGGRGCVPFPAAGTNTLCVSDSATLALVPTLVPTVPTPPSMSSSVSAASTDSPARNTLTESKRTSSSSEKLVLSFRVGDSRSPWGSHLASVEVRLHLHRWNPRGGVGHTSRELSLRCKGEPGAGTKGGLRVSLWAPVVVEHEVDAQSPLRSALVEGWPVNRSPDTSSGLFGGSGEDTVGGGRYSREYEEGLRGGDTSGEGDGADPTPRLRMTLAPDVELVVEVQATTCANGAPVVRRRCYRARDLRVCRTFVPITSPSSKRALWAEPRVDFDEFHTTAPTRAE